MQKSNFVFLCILSAFSILIARSVFLLKNENSHISNMIQKSRKEILDCNKEILAFSQETRSIYIVPQQLTEQSIKFIKSNFNVNIEELQKSKKTFVWFKRHISNNDQIIFKKNIPGIKLAKDYKRIYSHPESTSHLIGYCDKNSHGKSGSELAFNNQLFSKSLQLTIDIRIQNILHEAIKQIYEEFDSEDASGIIVKINGEVKAITSYPSPNSDLPITYTKDEKLNHNLSPIEVGSILKLHNAAMCLENGIVNLDTIVDATGSLQIGKFEIQDFFGKDKKMTFLDSVRFSSNIATGRLALSIGAEKQREFLQKLGFLSKIEWIPNHFANPLIPKRWGKSTTATISYGYGIGLTSLHVAQGMMRILSGTSRNLSFYYPNNQKEKIIISDHTVESIKIIMRTITKSSYRSINIEGYEIGGKTGTANICKNGKYIEGNNRVSYLGAFPINNPKYIFLIQTTNPKKSKLKYGRFTVASNVLTNKVKHIIQEIASIDNISPI